MLPGVTGLNVNDLTNNRKNDDISDYQHRLIQTLQRRLKFHYGCMKKWRDDEYEY